MYLDEIISFKVLGKSSRFLHYLHQEETIITLYNKPRNYPPVTSPRGDRRWYHRGGPQRGGGCSGTCQSTGSKGHLSG